MTAERNVRFGLVGYGRWGRNHAQAIRSAEGAELTAVAAQSAESRSAAEADHPDAAVYEDFRELVKRDDVDVVDAVVPTHLHHGVGMAALEASKHLFVEKPMASTVEQCRELTRQGRDRGLVVAVGFKRRVAQLWTRVKDLIDEGAIGEPQYAVFELWRRPYRLGSQGWRFDIERVGSWILEEPVHFFDKARWYLGSIGEPLSVYAAANSRQPGHPELQDNFSAIVRFPRGGHAVITQTLSAFEHHQAVKLTGTHGALWALWDGSGDTDAAPRTSLKLLDSENEIHDVPIPTESQEQELVEEIRSVVRAVRDGEPPAASGEDGIWSVALCHAAQESVDGGGVVSVEGFEP